MSSGLAGPYYNWDPKKAASNFRKHGVTFPQAVDALNDPMALFLNDVAHSENEFRQWCIGMAEPGVLVVAFTTREGDNDRIIMARKANRGEWELYNEKQQ